MQKYTIRRLRPSIQKFLNVVEIDLNRLQRHKINFEKFNRLQDWDGLSRELVNASRTLQQIKSNIQEIEKTRQQIVETDLGEFDDEINSVKDKALLASNEFLELYTFLETKKNSVDVASSLSGCKTNGTQPLGYLDPESDSDVQTLMLSDCDELILSDNRLELHTVPENTEASEALENLKKDLLELNDLIHQFSSAVHSQQGGIDRIEGNIDHAHDDVDQGVRNIGAASKLKKAIFPVAGALIGGVMGGPVGLVAGIKIGAMAAVGGSILGLAGGSVASALHSKKVDYELQDLSRSRPRSSNTDE